MKKTLLVSLMVCALSAGAQTNYVKVVDFMPAPGQFVNSLPRYEEGFTQDSMNLAAEYNLNNESMISLGTYGGYVIFQFDHAVPNVGVNGRGSDFLINGNGFYAANNPNGKAPSWGGSIEPGIVYVGVGDDYKTCKWYELAGSMYSQGIQITDSFYCAPEIHDFEITYYKPEKEKADDPSEREQFASSLDYYIFWECNWTENGERVDSTGWHMKNIYHNQTYWPAWIDDYVLTFKGGKLPNNAIDESGVGRYWVQYRYGANSYGYVDAAPNSVDSSLNPDAKGTNPENTFDIDWAVDENGHFVHLDSINFIKVVCGTFQYCGWLGETSTEISKIEDLTLREGYAMNPIILDYSKGWSTEEADGVHTATLPRESANTSDGRIYDLQGRLVQSPQRGHLYIRNNKKFIYE